jgi:hypothetical protein
MSDTKKADFDINSLVPWIAVGVLGYMLWTKDASPTPAPDPKPVTVTIEKATSGVLATMRTENARVFNLAADKVEKGEIRTDKELFDFIQPATKAAREQANKPFDMSLEMSLPRNEDGSFAGKEIEAAKILRKVAKSW